MKQSQCENCLIPAPEIPKMLLLAYMENYKITAFRNDL